MYDIFMGSQVVGQAEATKEGLYYRFTCKCSPPDEGIHRIVVSDENNTRDLGICVPAGEWFCLVSRVPIKYLSDGELNFTLLPRENDQKVVPVVPNEAFEDLDMLDSAYLQESEGNAEIVISPVPDQQDSGQSQGSPHKWE